MVAYCNATSSARLAARYPASGGTYVYGRERLGPFWGYLAGWAFVVGKTASCAAMALTVGAYVWPEQAHAVAVAAVVALTAVNYGGVQKSALADPGDRGGRAGRPRGGGGRPLSTSAPPTSAGSGGRRRGGAGGVLQAAGLLFFAFAGYARIATLGEEVRDPARTIPRAIPMALGITLVVYACVAVAVLSVLGAAGWAAATAPLADAVGRRAAVAGPVVRVGAAVAALGSLLALILGVSRTTLAMARDRHLPRARRRPPALPGPAPRGARRGLVVAVVAATVDVRGAIGFSSFGVLVYYAIANASAWTLRFPMACAGPPWSRRCLVLAFAASAVLGPCGRRGAGGGGRGVRGAGGMRERGGRQGHD